MTSHFKLTRMDLVNKEPFKVFILNIRKDVAQQSLITITLQHMSFGVSRGNFPEFRNFISIYINEVVLFERWLDI